MESLSEKLSRLEALLFIHGEPLTFKKIGDVLDLKENEVKESVEEFKKLLESSNRGLTLITDKSKVQLVTKPQFHNILEKFVKEELAEDLTPASLEALAIIAYFGPISRARLEYLRGVNSVFILRNLMIRGLVERLPDPDRPNSFIYQATFEFWKHLGLKNKEDLPDYAKFQGLTHIFESPDGGQPPGAAGSSQPAQT